MIRVRTILTISLVYNLAIFSYALLHPQEFVSLMEMAGYPGPFIDVVRGQAAGLAGLCTVGIVAVGYSHWIELQRTRRRLEGLAE